MRLLQKVLNSSLTRTGFFKLWLGEAISLAGTQITTFAIPLIAVLTLHANAWQMSLLGAAGSAATLLFGLFVGVWADRYERKRLLLFANAGRCLVLFAIPVLYWSGYLSLPVLLAVTFVVGVLSLLFDSTMSAYLPGLVGTDGLTTANSWLQGSVSVGEIAGPGLAGILVQILTAPIVILVDIASYLVSSFAIVTLPGGKQERQQEGDDEQPHLQAALAGLRLLWNDRIQGPLALAAAHFNLFTSMFFVLYTLYVIRVLHFSPFLLGLTTTIGGVGGLLGASMSSRIARLGYGRVLCVAYALPGLAGLLVPLAQSFGMPYSAILVGASSALWSCSVVINLVLSEAIKQAYVPDYLLGRVTATVRFISWGIEPLGALLAGALAVSFLGLRGTLLLAASGVATSALWPWLSGAVRSLRSLPSDTHEEPETKLIASILEEEMVGR